MKKLLCALLLCLSLVAPQTRAAYDPADFVTCTEFGFNAKYPNQYMNVWMNTFWQDEKKLNVWPKNGWTMVDASGYVPPGTKAIWVSTVLIITPGTVQPLINNLTIAFRRHNAGPYIGKGNGWLNPSDYPSNPDLALGGNRYVQQTMSQNPYGSRSNGANIVALDENGRYDIWIGVPAGAFISPYALYGLNVNIEGWCK